MSGKTFKIPGIRQWKAKVRVSAPIPGEFADWPANIQDGLWKALGMQLATDGPKTGWAVEIVASKCVVGPASAVLHVTAQEFPPKIGRMN